MQQSWWPLKIFTEHKTDIERTVYIPISTHTHQPEVVRIYINNPPSPLDRSSQRAESREHSLAHCVTPTIIQCLKKLASHNHHPLHVPFVYTCVQDWVGPGGQLAARNLFPALVETSCNKTPRQSEGVKPCMHPSPSCGPSIVLFYSHWSLTIANRSAPGIILYYTVQAFSDLTSCVVAL